MKEKKFTNWVKKHKTKLLITGGVIVTTVGAVLLIDNWDLIKGLVVKDVKNLPVKSLDIKPEVATAIVVDNEPVIKIDVRKHLRNLPKEHHPSTKKILEAIELGVDLEGKKTIVSDHSRCYVA